MEYNSLTHHGILGMKWGRRRYQNKDGSLTAAGKKRYGDDNDDPEEAKKAYEEGKQRAIRSGSATEVLKYKGDLTRQEMDSVIARLNWEQSMKSISDKELAVGKSTSEKFFERMGKATDYAQTTAKAYNMVANVLNAFGGANGKTLPKIELDIKSGNKDLRKKEAAARKKEEEAAAKKAKAEADAAKKKKDEENLKNAQKQVDDYNAKLKEQYEREASQYHKVFKRNSTVSDVKSDTSTSRGESYVSGLLGGKVSSKKSNNSGDIIDGTGLFKDLGTTYDNTISSGQSFVSGLLEEPKR